MAENKENIIGPGMFVKYSYTLTDDADGKVLFEASKKEPDEMIYGVSQEVIPGLIATLKGLKAGDRFEVTLPQEAAFGPHVAENVIDLEKDIFMQDGEMAKEVKVGAMIPMMTAEGYRVYGKVLEIGDKVKMDFNHPFAGKTVTYKGEIETVREATPEELKPTPGCGGCGGGCGSHEHGGCCGDSGCGDGCCH